ncbi:sulfur carrier protein ThiS adenylyltransferase ThiF [Vallitalea pronyensis]|uniref:Sulfur carrier protein ThiS adenylyltransferase ThiF n=1 Tax=Vallitalea pronyensis TaxID=1348613 RepID=A0A8J8ML35_9FIRM|nr:sulfur carrier protein ThiS adenylyltransferase ThiF [Vallitalea pronyensis]QUI23392.1 sulfur carrier protein ThiS adenylyltransferase ThiF [Vallitalea pronyensis]
MKIVVNEKNCFVPHHASAYAVRDMIKNDADIIIVNGHVIHKDITLKAKDTVTLIKRGEKPKKRALEALLVARHTPGVHERIKNACVGIAGLGGLGSHAAVSLARLGIGKLILIDYDVVEPSNLNRQHYFLKHIGMKKTSALKDILEQINPFVKIVTKDVCLDQTNIAMCFREPDIVIEAFDHPESKAVLVNTLLSEHKTVVAASGVAGYFSNNTITTKRVMKNLYVIGDGVSEAKIGSGLMAPRVAIAANHQANMVLRLILGERHT